jgi:hypothetical protein
MESRGHDRSFPFWPDGTERTLPDHSQAPKLGYRSLLRSPALLEDLLHLKRFVFAVYRLASQHRATLEAFLRPDFPLVGGDIAEPYFRDLDVRLGRLLDALGAAK